MIGFLTGVLSTALSVWFIFLFKWIPCTDPGMRAPLVLGTVYAVGLIWLLGYLAGKNSKKEN